MKASGWRDAAWARFAAVVLTLLSLSLGGQAQAAETTTYVLTDVQGTVLAREDAQGNIIARYDYRPYGKQQTGPVAAGPGYTGHVGDPDTGLVYMQQRYYDPSMGRFLSVDPIAPTPGQASIFNRYTYAGNNPIDNIDPDGRADCPGQDRSKCIRSDAGAAADLRATEAQKAAASDNMAKVETRVKPEKVLALVGTSDVTVQAISGKQIYIPGKKDGVSVTNMPSGSAILHSHIDGKTPGRSSDGFVSPGDAIHTLRNGVVNFVVSERRLAVYQIVDGRIQINVLKGAFTGREANLLEKSINAQQPYVDAARPR